MTKVLFISNHAGFSKFNTPYIKYLRDKNIVVHNASPGVEIDSADIQFDIPITRSPISVNNFRAFLMLFSICKNNRYDLIHCHTPTGGLLGRLIKIFFPKTRILYTAHGFHFFKNSSFLSWLIFFPVEYLLSYLTDCIVTINEEDYNLSIKYLKASENFKINGVGIDLHRFIYSAPSRLMLRESLGIHNNDFVFIYVAQLIKRKNHEFIIDAYSNALLDSRVKFLFVGDGPLRSKLEKSVADLGLSDKIIFSGYVSNVEQYYSAADALVSVSNQEGFGINLVEGLACGLPFIASNVRGHRDIHLLVNNNLLYELGNSSDFLNSLFKIMDFKMLDSSPISQSICSNNSRQFCQSLSVSEMAKVYNNLLFKKY